MSSCHELNRVVEVSREVGVLCLSSCAEVSTPILYVDSGMGGEGEMLRYNEDLKSRRFGQHDNEGRLRRWPSRCYRIDACARSTVRFLWSTISICLFLLSCTWIAPAVAGYPDGKKSSCSSLCFLQKPSLEGR
jgi:hypothetical protein